MPRQRIPGVEKHEADAVSAKVSLADCASIALEGVPIKIALHFDPPSVAQYNGQPATRLLLWQRFPEGQFHCHELPSAKALFVVLFQRLFFR